MKSKKQSSAKSRLTGSGKAQHVFPENNHWVVRSSGSAHPASTYETQAEAISAAREVAKGHHSDVVIHSRDGRIKHRVSVSPADELMLRVWKGAHKSFSKPKGSRLA